MPLRHAAPSAPQLPGSLYRLAKVRSHRPPDFLSGHPIIIGGDYAQEVDSVGETCGAHGGHETAEVHDIRTGKDQRNVYKAPKKHKSKNETKTTDRRENKTQLN